MFETAIPSPVVGAETGSGLRPLDWNELVARLSAARELRAVFARPAPAAASFGAQAREGFTRAGGGERDVNLDALGRGKTPTAISVATVEEAAVGDQGTR